MGQKAVGLRTRRVADKKILAITKCNVEPQREGACHTRPVTDLKKSRLKPNAASNHNRTAVLRPRRGADHKKSCHK